MSYLLDTHVLLWASDARESQRLSKPAIAALADTTQDIYISTVTLWEIAIKASLPDRFEFFRGSLADLYAFIGANGIRLLGIRQNHLEALQKLPFVHRDPFARLIVATALAENLVIVTADKNIQTYPAAWLW
ncbi:MAG: type II toxin-antitoxin system VapC family toxin [Coriobacteriales bacterium]|nr:type II toxin-antitoxin system VapC family toxin [Coriobacteriales bacterium]